MVRLFALFIILFSLAACGGGDSTANTGEPSDPDTGKITPVLNSNLNFDGNLLPDICQFEQNQLFNFSECSLEFSISLTQGSVQDASFVGQFSTNSGNTWQNLTTTAAQTFTLDISSIELDSVAVRASMIFEGQASFTDSLEFSLKNYELNMLNPGDFAQDQALYISDSGLGISLPSCSNNLGLSNLVKIYKNGLLLSEQNSGAVVNIINNGIYKEGDILSASCKGVNNQNNLSAPGNIKVTFNPNTSANLAPIAVFNNLPTGTLYHLSKIRDFQLISFCVTAIDPEKEALTYQFSAEIAGVSTPIASQLNCAELDTSNLGNQTVTLIADVSDGENTVRARRELGMIHQDNLSVAQAENSTCIIGSGEQNISISVARDTEFDSYQVSAINTADLSVLKEFGQVTTANLSLPCDQIGQLNYKLVTTSRTQTIESISYSHSVTEIPNQAPSIELTIAQTPLANLRYRDNIVLDICANAQDVDGDQPEFVTQADWLAGAAPAYYVEYQWDNNTKEFLTFTNDCAQIDTKGRGGQQLRLYSDVRDVFTNVSQVTDLGFIHADTIQFATTLDGNCTEGDPALTYTVSISPDTEGDEHYIQVLDATTNQLIAGGDLGSVTTANFNLACDQIGQTQFRLKNESRGLTVFSRSFNHNVTPAPNLPPKVEYSLTGTQINLTDGDFPLFRDKQLLEICFTVSDPEGEAVNLTGRYQFEQQSPVDFVLDSNLCSQIDLVNKGNQGLSIDMQASDGETTQALVQKIADIDQDQIQIAQTSSNQCLQGSGSLEYLVTTADDPEGDDSDLTVVFINSLTPERSLGLTSGQSAFSLSCQNLGSESFYIKNESRGLTTFSLVYQHQVVAPDNNPPTVSFELTDPVRYTDLIRDNQSFNVCLTASDLDGDNLSSSIEIQFDNEATQTLALNNSCGVINTDNQGGKILTVTATTSDGEDTATATGTYSIHQDTVQLAYSQNQNCRIGDADRTYDISVAADIEGDINQLEVYNVATNALIRSFAAGQTQGSFSLPCNTNGRTEFVVRNTARGISTQSLIYAHVVANENNTRPTITLAVNNTPERFNGLLRDEQSVEICATVNDADGEDLVTQLFYRFDNQALQTLTLTNLCGTIDLTGQGSHSLVVQGFTTDGTATGADTLDLGFIHEDTIQTAISGSGSCRAGDSESVFSVNVAADAEGDIYSIDAVDAITSEVLASMGQITVGTFSLSCGSVKAVDFVIRTTSRNLVQNSLVYSHVVADTLNSKPVLTINTFDIEQYDNQVRDGQDLQVCLSGTDSDGDALTYRAAYQFSSSGFKTLDLATNACGLISTSGKGEQSLIIQGFVDDGFVESTQILDLGEIHLDTLATPETVSGSCALGEQSIIYTIELEQDAEADNRSITVANASGSLIAQLEEGDAFEFSMPCNQVGQTEFNLTATSRELVRVSETYTHTINPSLVNTARVWLTTADKNALLAEQEESELRVGLGTATNQIDISDTNTYQEIKGFGAALTDSAASLINASASQEQILTQLFDQETGIGLKYLRLPVAGLGEFVARAATSYNDRPEPLTDPTLDLFSIDNDLDYLIPSIKAIQNIQPDIHLNSVSWSAPAWMKDNKSLNGGSLEIGSYPVYADYLARYFSAYADQGINITSFSFQNQPHLESDFPSMLWQNDDYALFFTDFLFPALSQNSVSTELWLWDGNFTDFDSQLDEDIAKAGLSYLARDFIFGRSRGFAFQCYQADNGALDYTKAFSAMLANDERFKDVYLTSCRNQNDGRSFGEYLTDTSADIIMPSFIGGASAVFFDSLALDENFGPHQGGCSDCRGLMTITTGDSVTENAEYYAIGHFSQFLQDKAVRIDATSLPNVLETFAYKNPDNTIVVVIANTSNLTQDFDLNWQGQTVFFQLAAKSMMTVVWDSDNSPVVDLQQIFSANSLTQDVVSLIAQMRDASGLYRENYKVSGIQDAAITPSATGFGLISLAIEHQMEWADNINLIQASLDALLGEVEGFVAAQNSQGIFASQMTTDGSALIDEYSTIETAYLVASLKFVQQAMPANAGEINQKVDDIIALVDLTGLVLNSDSGTVTSIQNAAGESIESQGPYNQQMLLVWLMNQLGDIDAQSVWQRYYETGKQFNITFYDAINLPADEFGVAISPTIHQLNYFLINPILTSANYRLLYADHALAEKAYWAQEQAQLSYIWGFGYGTDQNNTSEAAFYNLQTPRELVVHAPTIAGFIPANMTALEDLLSWQNADFGLLDTGFNSIEIPWRHAVDDTSWRSEQIEMLGLMPMLLGLSAHPGLLDITYFRQNNNFDFTVDE
ncbi:glycoside hydrolase family 30 protein [Catenovulum maritimum]|uniref:Glucosylceramidase n=1 Tax=Catenovulum maritimum TaxID=1513271 RepID=A0A0J8GU79_9ALTE|nr:glycoside hydrolase family 30 beta sandwich domain-containing protein [Catenovulum maritimum]KMT66297.1 hypothetical protein XM47_04715 [Catenovulum maritimum]